MANAAAMPETPPGMIPVSQQKTFMGHPVGLFVLFFTEMWERFSYYGMRSLLVLYMVNFLFIQPDVGREVLGFNAIKGALESAFGPLGIQPLSSQIYGLYTGFVYFTPFFGGLLADRVLGQRRTVIVGGVLMAIGHFLMAIHSMFFPALMFLILGNGCFKPNISTQVGLLYAQGDARRDRAFSIFYVGINLGAFLSPLVCGTLGQKVGWHYGFGAAGIGMCLGLVIYILGQKYLATNSAGGKTGETGMKAVGPVLAYLIAIPLGIGALLFMLTLPKIVPALLGAAVLVAIVTWIARLPKDEKPRVIVIAVACLIVAAFWAVYEQQGNTLQLWADQNTRWEFFGMTMPSTWFQAFNPFMIFFVTPILTWVWGKQALRGKEPASLTKMSIGATLLGLGFVIMIAASHGQPVDVKRSVAWLFFSTLVYTCGELYLSPIGLSFVTKVAPARIVSMMMGVWFLANFIGNYMTGYLGTFWEKMPHQSFFALMTAIGVAAGFVLFLISRPMNKIVDAHEKSAA